MSLSILIGNVVGNIRNKLSTVVIEVKNYIFNNGSISGPNTTYIENSQSVKVDGTYENEKIKLS